MPVVAVASHVSLRATVVPQLYGHRSIRAIEIAFIY